MYWLDSHCHLDMAKTPIEDIVQKLTEYNVQKVVSIGTVTENNLKMLSIVNQHDNFYCTIGLHPNYVSEKEISEIQNFGNLIAKNKKILAIGECGYDQHNPENPKVELQQIAFEKQLDLALQLNKPVVVHSREAENITIASLKKYQNKNLKILLHSFTSKVELFDYGLENNCWFSFNAITTFKNGADIKDYFLRCPIDKMLLETDSPFLAPAPFRGKENIPAYVAIVGESLANFKGMSILDFQNQILKNSYDFYGAF